MKAQILAANVEYKSLTAEQKKGAVDGDSISGDIGTQMGAFPFSGQRKL